MEFQDFYDFQFDDKVIISGSSDSTIRVWDVETGEMINTLIHHCEAVLHLRSGSRFSYNTNLLILFCSFNFSCSRDGVKGMMVTCSKDKR